MKKNRRKSKKEQVVAQPPKLTKDAGVSKS